MPKRVKPELLSKLAAPRTRTKRCRPEFTLLLFANLSMLFISMLTLNSPAIMAGANDQLRNFVQLCAGGFVVNAAAIITL